MPIIEAKNLEKVYGVDGVKTPALRGVSLDIKKGEFVAIMGPSGSGKSTLLHILGFLDSQTNGTYRFNGKEMTDYSKDELAAVRNKEMGFVFQAFNLLPRMTVFENVRLPLLYSGIKESLWSAMVEKAIEEVGLFRRAGHEAYKLSGGEKQRTAIARALVNRPEVIFADEPTGNLDSKSGVAILEILQKLNRDHGHTIILITHEINMAKYTKRIINLKDGRIESDKKI
jgi:putative ABC transport system ATP-binding protein